MEYVTKYAADIYMWSWPQRSTWNDHFNWFIHQQFMMVILRMLFIGSRDLIRGARPIWISIVIA